MRGNIASPKLAGITTGLLLSGALLLLPDLVRAAGLVELPGLAYDVNTSMADNLKSLIGKKVHVTLANGAALTGQVKAVSSELLHLEKLEEKEYFDALIRIANIGAIDTRFRDYQR
jgi:small nuclear ribonucleoprotein (snRNP)-like protein